MLTSSLLAAVAASSACENLLDSLLSTGDGSKETDACGPGRQNIFLITERQTGNRPAFIGANVTRERCQDSIRLHVSGNTFLPFNFGKRSGP